MMKIQNLFGLALALVFSAGAFAQGETVYTCQQIKDGFGPANKVLQVIVPARHTEAREGLPFPVAVALYQNGTSQALFQGVAVATVEDVMFQFEVKGAGLSGTIFLDELDQTYLKVGGRNLRFDCGSL